jgi:hypothetical protein
MSTLKEPSHSPSFREINLSAEVKKIWGAKWDSPELAYEFSNDRKFYLRTEDAGIYSGASNSPIEDETSIAILDETGEDLLAEISGP